MAPYTETQRAALQAALTSGAMTVEYDGKRVTYRSIDEIKKALDEVNRDLNSQAGTPSPRQFRVTSAKGF